MVPAGRWMEISGRFMPSKMGVFSSSASTPMPSMLMSQTMTSIFSELMGCTMVAVMGSWPVTKYRSTLRRLTCWRVSGQVVSRMFLITPVTSTWKSMTLTPLKR